MDLTTRNAELSDFVQLLQQQHAAKLDVVAPASAIRARNGMLELRDTDVELSADGVTTTAGTYRPTAVCDEGLADKLGIPVAYLKRLRSDAADLYDANVNGWLHGKRRIGADGERIELRAGDSRKFLVRCFRGDDEGVARAVLSDTYKRMDNLDMLMAALDGVREAGMHVEFDGCDLTERRMYVRLVAPEVRALAPTLLANYRSPFSGQSGADLPVVSAGLVLSNSETGGGAFTIVPRIVVQVCKNGMTRPMDALRAVHLGARMDEGVVRWSEATQERNVELVRSMTADAVRTFLDVEYVTKVLADVEGQASTAIAGDAAEAVKLVGQRLRYTQEQQAGILDHFIRGGDVTAGGIMQAVTSYAQTVEDADTAAELEDSALRALELAATGR